MTTEQEMGEEPWVDIRREGIKIGILNGLFALLILYSSYWMGLEAFIDIKMGERIIPYMIIILLISGFALRRRNGGYLTFKQALQFAFSSYVVAAILIAIGTYILYNLVDPNLGKESFELGLQRTREIMEKIGAPEEEIEENISRAQKAGSETDFKHIFLGMGLGLIWDFMKSLLIALVIRKEKPAF